MAEKNTKVNYCFEVEYFVHCSSHRLAVCGSIPDLGNWSPSGAVMAKKVTSSPGRWEVSCELPQNEDFEWKWAVIDTSRKQRRIIRWEERDNRKMKSGTSNGKITTKWNYGRDSPSETVSKIPGQPPEIQVHVQDRQSGSQPSAPSTQVSYEAMDDKRTTNVSSDALQSTSLPQFSATEPFKGHDHERNVSAERKPLICSDENSTTESEIQRDINECVAKETDIETECETTTVSIENIDRRWSISSFLQKSVGSYCEIL